MITEIAPQFKVFMPDIRRICLWCKKAMIISDSEHEYHIIPKQFTESDSYKYTLPKYIICDQCNSSFGKNSESALIELMKERLAFLKQRKRGEQFEVDSLKWDISKGKLSIHMDRLLESPASRIPHPKYSLGTDFLGKKVMKLSLRNRGLINTAIQKIAMEILYSDCASSFGDKYAYNLLLNSNHNFYKLTNLVKDFVARKTDKLFNNVQVVSSKYGFQGNINSIRITSYENQKGERGECIFLFLCGIQFLVSFLPKGNSSLTIEETHKLVKNNYEKMIQDAKDNKKE